MLARKLFVSASDSQGSFISRGMVAEERAAKEFEAFAETPMRGKALFMVISGHDGRIELRHAGAGRFAAKIVGANRRERMLWGLLPAREPVVWEPGDLEIEECKRLIRMLYTLPREVFTQRVAQELH